KVIENLKGDSYQFVNTDSSVVNFPEAFKGDIVAVTFIYTHCPNTCPLITANLTNIQDQLEDTTGIHFVEITFDPKRDTPAVLKNYKRLYKLNDQFSMLSGDTANTQAVLKRLHIKATKTYPDSADTTSSNYFFTHTNRLYLMDRQGRIRYQFTASVVPPKTVISEINKLR
ncbi:MAG TPA: SCO family protein, partial [Balneolaceae bacterium]|nr:SCO family protein [Balneolaceae bacterium]